MTFIRAIYDWAIRLSGTKHAAWALAGISFIESSIFPLPPDVVLIPMCLARRDKAFLYATVCTVTSVLGGLLGYWIGHAAFESFGKHIVELYGFMGKFDEMKKNFNEYGGWIILAKGMTPLPYKILTILAGVMNMPLPLFIASSIGARAMRFYLVAGLLWKFGEPVRHFIEKYLGWVTLGFLILLIGGFVALKYIL